jgi:hypothetical protein
MKKETLVPVGIGLGMMLLLVWISETMPIVLVFIPGVIVSFLIYLNTIYRKIPEPNRILPLYLLALRIQFIQSTTEKIERQILLTSFVSYDTIFRLTKRDNFVKIYGWKQLNFMNSAALMTKPRRISIPIKKIVTPYRWIWSGN